MRSTPETIGMFGPMAGKKVNGFPQLMNLSTNALPKKASHFVWILLYMTLVTGTVYAIMHNWAYDDPFITYRYAYNLAHGSGFVYNPGERILSTTTPFFALLLAAISPLWADFPRLANLIGAFSLALGAIFLRDLANSWKTPIVGWVALLLYPTFPLLISTLGSEIPLYLAFCLGTFAFYARRRYFLTAIFAALAVLTRPDGVLIPAILAIDHLIRERGQIPLRSILLFLCLTMPWFIFAWFNFGSPFPATLAAKQHQGSMAISQRFVPGFFALAGAYAQYWHYTLVGILSFLGILFSLRRSPRWLLLISWTIVYFAAYTILGVTPYFWYYAPLVPSFIVTIGLGIAALNDLIRARFKQKMKRFRFSLVILTIGLVILLTISQISDLRRLQQRQDPRALIYQVVGTWLKDNIPQNAKVGTTEIGIIGYYAQRPMVDFAGLLQPETAAKLTTNTTYADAARWAVQRYQPDYLVLHSGMFTGLEQNYAAQHCHIVQRFPGEPYGYKETLDVYACNPPK